MSQNLPASGPTPPAPQPSPPARGGGGDQWFTVKGHPRWTWTSEVDACRDDGVTIGLSDEQTPWWIINGGTYLFRSAGLAMRYADLFIKPGVGAATSATPQHGGTRRARQTHNEEGNMK